MANSFGHLLRPPSYHASMRVKETPHNHLNVNKERDSFIQYGAPNTHKTGMN
jgi:hypothetical protein